MGLVRIIFKGKTRDIYNSVDMATFEKIYKPKGWKLLESEEKQERRIINELNTETKIRNYNKVKKVKERKFDDGLFKKDGK